ncbi:cytochrome c [Aureispira sp. CCB-QB1]|uniref:c-type cytochrome n=1 Tax=Aureispira sp. CCB-QB1 TaxID=1313421 RepID=UPI0006990AA3|nr:cytochrome c [Aureispira sp. CCB-QB1]
MEGKELFKQMDKISKLGALIGIAFIILIGLVLQEGLSSGFQDESALVVEQEKTVVIRTSNKVDGDVIEGKDLFLQKCASCHNIDMVSDMIGPALYGAVDRWGNWADLYQWVQDYSVLIEQEHPRALEMEKWSPSIMTAFSNLDTTQIRNIFAFVEMKTGF